jgi:hypothetical protein
MSVVAVCLAQFFVFVSETYIYLLSLSHIVHLLISVLFSFRSSHSNHTFSTAFCSGKRFTFEIFQMDQSFWPKYFEEIKNPKKSQQIHIDSLRTCCLNARKMKNKKTLPTIVIDVIESIKNRSRLIIWSTK